MGVKTACKDTYAREVAALLELPYPGNNQGEAYRIVGAIFKAIGDALRRGERVSVDGFGIFSVRTRPATREHHYFYPYLKKKGLHQEVVDVPARRYVHFRPSTPLRRIINDEPQP